METIDRLIEWRPTEIRRNYEGTAFASVTINFGPRTVSVPHRDWANLSWGWCSICSLGNFNPTKGGHLVLWDLKLVVQFPPGSSITIPSAMVQHSNTPIGLGETRYSVAQFNSAGLFRWVDNGFMTDSDWLQAASEEDKERRENARRVRWKAGLKMLSHYSEL